MQTRGKYRFARMVAVFLLLAVTAAGAASYQQVADGVAIYFGILPAELVRGHPPGHPEGGMHGGVPVGENHITIALFDDKTGARITRARVTATITGPDSFKATKKLEPMTIAGSVTYGNYFSMPGPGPYRIVLHIQAPDTRRSIEAVFSWARS
ncbi:MAG: iron transporter [Pseudomonadota bacterium]